MKRWLSAMLLAVFIPLSVLSASGEGVIPVKPGDPAPADGYFVPKAYLEEALAQSLALRASMETIEAEKKSIREQMRRSLETADQVRQIAVDAEKNKARYEIEALREAITARDKAIVEKDKRIYDLEHPPWWKSQWIGAAGATLLFVLGALL